MAKNTPKFWYPSEYIASSTKLFKIRKYNVIKNRPYLFINVITRSNLSISTSIALELSGTRLTFLKFGDSLRQVTCPLVNERKHILLYNYKVHKKLNRLLLVISDQNDGMKRCDAQNGWLSSTLRSYPLTTQRLV